MDTPSTRMIAAATEPKMVKDSAGREIVLRRLGAVDRLRLFKILGPELAQNPPYLGMAILAASATAIDGVPVPPPTTEAQLEAMVRHLGDVGMAAIAAGLAENVAAMGGATQGN